MYQNASQIKSTSHAKNAVEPSWEMTCSLGAHGSNKPRGSLYFMNFMTMNTEAKDLEDRLLWPWNFHTLATAITVEFRISQVFRVSSRWCHC